MDVSIKSDGAVEKVKSPASGQQDYPTDFPGLRLRVFASRNGGAGRKVWFIRARVAKGPARFIVLGEYPALKKSDAEAACAAVRHELRQGIDPQLERTLRNAATKADSMTYASTAAEFLEDMDAVWARTTAAKNRSVLLGGRFGIWKDKAIAAITSEDIDRALVGLNTNSMQTYTTPLGSMFKFAVKRKYIAISPVDDIKTDTPAPEGNALPLVDFAEGEAPVFDELAAFLDVLDEVQQQHPDSAWPKIYMLGLLTGGRYNEVVGIRWSELDFGMPGRETWTLPKGRSKIKRTCVRPLSAAAVEILRGVQRRAGIDLLFPGKIAGQELSKTGREPLLISEKLAARGYRKGFWFGRVRDTVATWLELEADASERARCVLLNHKPQAANVRQKNYVQISGQGQARVLAERWAAAVQAARTSPSAQGCAKFSYYR